MALVVRPAEECPGIVRDLAGRGVPFVIVYAAGFAETGRAGEDLQHALVLPRARVPRASWARTA